MTSAERQALIDRYAEGHHVVLEALSGATDAELDARPPEGWTAREVVHHLADSEMTSAIRLRRLLAEDAPALGSYDEEAFARVLRYCDRPIQPALDALAAARTTTLQILLVMSDKDWQRAGTHTEHGLYSAEDWLRSYAAHAHEHAAQIGQCLRAARSSRSPEAGARM